MVMNRFSLSEQWPEAEFHFHLDRGVQSGASLAVGGMRSARQHRYSFATVVFAEIRRLSAKVFSNRSIAFLIDIGLTIHPVL